MKVNVLDISGKIKEEMDFAGIESDFVPSVDQLLKYVRIYQVNQRQGTVSTKDRTSISGGGRKPWKQKGTGRARAGSNSSPLWVGGASALGPHPKFWSLHATKNLKYNAFKSSVALKLKDNRFSVLDVQGDFDKPSTSKASVLSNALSTKERILVVHDNDNVYKSFRNVQNVNVKHVKEVNAFDVASAAYVLVMKDTMNSLSEKF